MHTSIGKKSKLLNDKADQSIHQWGQVWKVKQKIGLKEILKNGTAE